MMSRPPTRAILIDDNLLIEISPKPEIIEPADPEAQLEGTASKPNAGDLVDQLERVGDRIGKVCTTLHTKALGAIQGSKPDEFEIEFGVTLAGELGIPMVSKGSAECEFRVRATWNLGHDPVAPNPTSATADQ